MRYNRKRWMTMKMKKTTQDDDEEEDGNKSSVEPLNQSVASKE